MKSLLPLLITTLCLTVFGIATAHAAETAPIPPAYTLGAEEVEDAVAGALGVNFGEAQLNVTLAGNRSKALYESATPVMARITGLTTQADDTRWSANLLVVDSTNTTLTALPIAGRVEEMVTLPVLSNALRSGETILATNITRETFPKRRLREEFLRDETALIGSSASSNISAGRPIRQHEIGTPAVLSRGSVVQMRFAMGGLEILATGQALAEGGMGDVIEVRNLSSRQVVRAVIDGPTSVLAIAPGALAAALHQGGGHANAL